MLNKNKKLLKNFTKYCEKNPSERFWQALINWSKYTFIFVRESGKPFNFNDVDKINSLGLKDTFYFENKNKQNERTFRKIIKHNTR